MIILTVSDLHCPWQHPDAFDFLADLARRYKPDKVVVLGDEIDAQAFSRFPRNPDMHSPGHEIDAAGKRCDHSTGSSRVLRSARATTRSARGDVRVKPECPACCCKTCGAY